ncbi:hypothetical protein [Roseburia sp. 499]|uniref:hypothetical protein n=1 Tax=Roseburia sp. 499 TaxID=1261634 RepID=UPI0009521344|nr:hypothetical protein [Roseburia sp. 499]WVK70924.1 hypothetical protein BIV20_05160 [Roseburia sp. 499]
MEVQKKWKKKHIVSGILIASIICLVTYFIHENSRVRFKDINMGISICGSIGYGYPVTVEDVRVRDLAKVKKLTIGNPQNYTTLEDIKKCKKLEELHIIDYAGADTSDYAVRLAVQEQEMKEEQVEEFQRELSQVLPKLRNLKSFMFTNTYGKCDIYNIDFLKGCKNLEEVSICHSNVKDYSVLSQLPRLKRIDLCYSSIETADDLLQLKEIEVIWVDNTPLAANEKEVQRLKEAFPEAEIYADIYK